MNALENECRENSNYTRKSPTTSSAFKDMLYWNSEARHIIDKSNIRLYEIRQDVNFEKFKRQKENECGEPLEIREFYHGPLFQKYSNLCRFDVAQKRCRGHSGQMILTAAEPFYINLKGIGVNLNQRSTGYVLFGKVMVRQEYELDPEDPTDFNQYFLQNDLIHDYGNNKYLKCTEDFYPTHIMFYERNLNPRLDQPYQPYSIELMDPPPPSATYENVVIERQALQDIFRCVNWNIRMDQIVSVQKIINPFLEAKFNRTKENFGLEEVGVKRVFHGISFERVDDVARFNLDWRKAMYGNYGWGVHLSQYPDMRFPYKYPTGPSKKRCMLACDMLLKNQVDFNEQEVNNLCMPPPDYDTVLRKTSFLKFEDHEFIPRFKIVYFNPDETNE